MVSKRIACGIAFLFSTFGTIDIVSSAPVDDPDEVACRRDLQDVECTFVGHCNEEHAALIDICVCRTKSNRVKGVKAQQRAYKACVCNRDPSTCGK